MFSCFRPYEKHQRSDIEIASRRATHLYQLFQAILGSTQCLYRVDRFEQLLQALLLSRRRNEREVVVLELVSHSLDAYLRVLADFESVAELAFEHADLLELLGIFGLLVQNELGHFPIDRLQLLFQLFALLIDMLHAEALAFHRRLKGEVARVKVVVVAIVLAVDAAEQFGVEQRIAWNVLWRSNRYGWRDEERFLGFVGSAGCCRTRRGLLYERNGAKSSNDFIFLPFADTLPACAGSSSPVSSNRPWR